MINLEKIKWKVPASLPLLRRPTPTPYFHSFLIFQVPSQFVSPLITRSFPVRHLVDACVICMFIFLSFNEDAALTRYLGENSYF